MPSQGITALDINMADSGSSKEAGGIDTNLYSRQLGAFGFEAMGKLMKMRVLVSGLRGVGVEIAKNLILAGPAAVFLHDGGLVALEDLASTFCATEKDVGKRTRAEAAVRPLAELNPYVRVDVSEGDELTVDAVKLLGVDVVVVSDMSRSNMVKINEYCRSQSPAIGFIVAETFGLCGSVFVDFGPDFNIFDQKGDEPKSAIIEGISQGNPGTVYVHQDKYPAIADGDCVVFREVEGMVELNSAPPQKVTRTGKFTFSIGDTSTYSPYTREGIMQQARVPSKMSFASLAESTKLPLAPGEHCLITPDLAKFGRSEQLHFAVQAVYDFQDCNGRLPSKEDVSECVRLAEKRNAESTELAKTERPLESSRPIQVDKIDESVVEKVAAFCSVKLSPVASFIGGVAAQEVVKYTGKFTPIQQWLYVDAFEAFPAEAPCDTAPLGSRYDSQILIWGRAFQEKLANLRLFVVGAGALGCEVLKMFALMGCCSGPKGNLTLTDMDHIEVSNLNRQFLFRRHHVGKSKSKTAAEVASTLNSDVKITALETRVGIETEDVFDDNFWESLDLVVNALDNVPSRLYVDGRCVWYHVPLLESGTLGTKANAQVVIPEKTQSYGDSQDPPEESIPLCTLKHFPNQIEHTIEWARDAFQGLFVDGPQEALSFLKNPDGYLSQITGEGTSATQRERLCKVHALLSSLSQAVAPTFEKCVRDAVELFTEYFDHQIAQLLHSFPLDRLTASGQPFWSGPKRAPRAISFDPREPLHLSFVMSTANLFAAILGIPQCRNAADVQRMAASMPVAPFVAKEMRIKVDEKDTTVEGSGDDETVLTKVSQDLLEMAERLSKKFSSGGIPLTVVEFEKDDDTNFHIDFVCSCANLRARNYKIPECDTHKAKMIAGKIIPAIATTTAMITGLVGLEFVKAVTHKDRPVEHFKNAFINMSLPLFLFSEPLPPLQIKDKDYDAVSGGAIRARPNPFTSWDKLEFNIPGARVEQLVEAIESTQKVEVCILSIGRTCLYNKYVPNHKTRLTETVKAVVERTTKAPLGRKWVAVEASTSDTDGVEVMLPTVKLVLE